MAKRRTNLTTQTRAEQIVRYFENEPNMICDRYSKIKESLRPPPSDARTFRGCLEVAMEMDPRLKTSHIKIRFDIHFVYRTDRTDLAGAVKFIEECPEEFRVNQHLVQAADPAKVSKPTTPVKAILGGGLGGSSSSAAGGSGLHISSLPQTAAPLGSPTKKIIIFLIPDLHHPRPERNIIAPK